MLCGVSVVFNSLDDVLGLMSCGHQYPRTTRSLRTGSYSNIFGMMEPDRGPNHEEQRLDGGCAPCCTAPRGRLVLLAWRLVSGFRTDRYSFCLHRLGPPVQA